MRFLNKGIDVIDRIRIKFFFILVCGLFALTFGYEWNIELVDRAGADYNSIDIDTLGRPHIAYFIGTGLRYAYKDSTDWQINNVAESCGQYLSLKLNQTGQPKISHISYIYNSQTGKLLYSYILNDTWYHTIVDTSQTCKYSSLALDSMANPCISYLNGGNHIDDTLKVKCAYLNNSIWDIQDVNYWLPYYFIELKSTSIVIDDIGRPHISHGLYGFEPGSEYGFADIFYALFDDSLWINLGIGGIGGTYNIVSFDKTSLKLDSNGKPHIASSMERSYPTFSKYLFYNYLVHDTIWFWVRVPDTLADTPALELDSLNRAHIVYISGNKLMYTIWDGNTWTFDTITTGNFSGDVSLKLDHDDNPHICFFSNGLYYAYGSPTGIEEIKKQNAISLMLGIYPNPVKSVLHVRGPLSEKSIKIFNASGRLIKEIATPSVRNDEVVEITLKGISPGIYFIRFSKETKKFLVVK